MDERAMVDKLEQAITEDLSSFPDGHVARSVVNIAIVPELDNIGYLLEARSMGAVEGAVKLFACSITENGQTLPRVLSTGLEKFAEKGNPSRDRYLNGLLAKLKNAWEKSNEMWEGGLMDKQEYQDLNPGMILESFLGSSAICGIANAGLDGGTISSKLLRNYKYQEPPSPMGINDTKQRIWFWGGGKGSEQDIGNHLSRNVDEKIFMSLLDHVPPSNKGNTAGICSLSINLGQKDAPVVINKNNVIDTIVDIGTAMDENNAPRDGHRWTVFHPMFIGMIKQGDLKKPDGIGLMKKNGLIGSIDGVNIYNSNRCPTAMETNKTAVHLLFGCSDAVSFAGRIERDKETQGKLIFGIKVNHPEELGVCYAVKGE